MTGFQNKTKQPKKKQKSYAHPSGTVRGKTQVVLEIMIDSTYPTESQDGFRREDERF